MRLIEVMLFCKVVQLIFGSQKCRWLRLC